MVLLLLLLSSYGYTNNKIDTRQKNRRRKPTNLKIWNASRICMSFLHRGHANLLCVVPILVYVLLKRALYVSYMSCIFLNFILGIEIRSFKITITFSFWA